MIQTLTKNVHCTIIHSNERFLYPKLFPDAFQLSNLRLVG